MRPLAVLTGGSRGIGAAILGRLLDAGYRCVVVGLNNPGRAETEFVQADLTDVTAAVRAGAQLREIVNGGQLISLLVNNAGGGFPSRLAETDPVQLNRDLALNLTSPMLLTSAVLPGMHAARAGTIINVASTAGRSGVAFLHAYSAAKAGLISFTQSLAAEYAPHGVRAYGVCPGAVATESAGHGRAELSRLHGLETHSYETAMAQRTGLGRLVQPDEVADVVQWLALHGSPALNGQTLNVCGTLTMG